VHIRTVLVEVTGAETRVGLRDRLFRVWLLVAALALGVAGCRDLLLELRLLLVSALSSWCWWWACFRGGNAGLVAWFGRRGRRPSGLLSGALGSVCHVASLGCLAVFVSILWLLPTVNSWGSLPLEFLKLSVFGSYSWGFPFEEGLRSVANIPLCLWLFNLFRLF
jgi:hypothetical protein